SVRGHVLLAGQATDDQATLSAPEPAVERLSDQVIAPQGELFGGVRDHSAPPAWTSPISKSRPPPPPRASSCWSTAAARRRSGLRAAKPVPGHAVDSTGRSRRPARPDNAAVASSAAPSLTSPNSPPWRAGRQPWPRPHSATGDTSREPSSPADSA